MQGDANYARYTKKEIEFFYFNESAWLGNKLFNNNNQYIDRFTAFAYYTLATIVSFHQ